MKYADIRVRCTHAPRQWHGAKLLPCASPGCEEGAPGEYLKSFDPSGEFVMYHRQHDYAGGTYGWLAPPPKPEPCKGCEEATKKLQAALAMVIQLSVELGSTTRLVDTGRPGNCNCFMICGHESGSTPGCVRWKT